MTYQVQGSGISEAWLSALEYLLGVGGVASNVVVTVAVPSNEDVGVRRAFDQFLAARRARGLQPISTVANTLFPEALYHRELGTRAAPMLYERYLEVYPILKRRKAWGTYFQRLIAWPNGGKPINQLADVIRRLKDGLDHGPIYKSAYEVALSRVDSAGSSGYEADAAICAEARVFSPGVDRAPRNVPCLSHLSFTFLNDRLDLTATYRSQYFISRAYGNYLGLSRILHFVCSEVGCQPGELVCIATLANAEVGTKAGLGAKDLKCLANECRQALAANA